MFCTKCGSELKDSYKVCPNCGQIIGNDKQPDEKLKANKDPVWLTLVIGVIFGIILIKIGFSIIGTACIVEGVLTPAFRKLSKPVLVLAEGIILVCVCIAIFNKYNNQTDDIPTYEDKSNLFVEEQSESEYVETEDGLNMPGENQIEYDTEDTNEMMWPDLDYYSVVTDNYASAYQTIETPEAEAFFSDESNLWYKSDSYQEWSTQDSEDYRFATIEPSPIDEDRTMQIGLEAKDGHKTTIEFNPLPAKIGPNGELIYYMDFGGHLICMTYFREDEYLHIEDSKYEFDGDYRRFK